MLNLGEVKYLIFFLMIASLLWSGQGAWWIFAANQMIVLISGVQTITFVREVFKSSLDCGENISHSPVVHFQIRR